MFRSLVTISNASFLLIYFKQDDTHSIVKANCVEAEQLKAEDKKDASNAAGDIIENIEKESVENMEKESAENMEKESAENTQNKSAKSMEEESAKNMECQPRV
uniref:Uncharacterized protein n=1 Tax=Amphimedon queenslandica TaxID=400682 RepID=A0A1X7VSF9_AMPQE